MPRSCNWRPDHLLAGGVGGIGGEHGQREVGGRQSAGGRDSDAVLTDGFQATAADSTLNILQRRHICASGVLGTKYGVLGTGYVGRSAANHRPLPTSCLLPTAHWRLRVPIHDMQFYRAAALKVIDYRAKRDCQRSVRICCSSAARSPWPNATPRSCTPCCVKRSDQVPPAAADRPGRLGQSSLRSCTSSGRVLPWPNGPSCSSCSTACIVRALSGVSPSIHSSAHLGPLRQAVAGQPAKLFAEIDRSAPRRSSVPPAAAWPPWLTSSSRAGRQRLVHVKPAHAAHRADARLDVPARRARQAPPAGDIFPPAGRRRCRSRPACQSRPASTKAASRSRSNCS